MSASVILPESGAKRVTRVIEEVSAGVTPVGAWESLRNTGGNGVVVQYDTEESEELGDGQLGVSGLTRVDTLGSFEYPFEYNNSALYDKFLASVLSGTWAANQLVPGTTAKYFTVEDSFPSVRENIALLASQVTQFSLVVESGAAVKGTFQGEGATVGPGAVRVIPVSNNINFAAGTNVISTTAATDVFATANVAVGDYIQVSNPGNAANAGYYRITAVAAKALTVDGTLVADTGDNPTLTVSPRNLVDVTGGTVTPKDTSAIFRAGNNVDVKLDGSDVLAVGLRIPQLELRVTTPTERAREITLDSPYITIPNDRQVEVTFQWHVVNLRMLRNLAADQDHTLEFTVGNGTHSRTFTCPRIKFAEGSPGAAGKGVTIMTGTSRMVSLLNGSGVNLQVNRVTS